MACTDFFLQFDDLGLALQLRLEEIEAQREVPANGLSLVPRTSY